MGRFVSWLRAEIQPSKEGVHWIAMVEMSLMKNEFVCVVCGEVVRCGAWCVVFLLDAT
jgi:hypothetical protein